MGRGIETSKIFRNPGPGDRRGPGNHRNGAPLREPDAEGLGSPKRVLSSIRGRVGVSGGGRGPVPLGDHLGGGAGHSGGRISRPTVRKNYSEITAVF